MTAPRSYAPGDAVLVVALKRRGQVLERRGRAYRVAVGGISITCREDEMQRVESPGPKRKDRQGTAPQRPAPPRSAAADIVSSIDLHGFTTLQVRDALLAHLDAALRAGHASFDVVHGIGTGRVRATVLAELQRIPSVREIRPHPTNRGVTRVYL
jgi:DNA mismatch repair protein MutS2